jgi:two-component system, OmpR family, sensor histidine kinase SenX3
LSGIGVLLVILGTLQYRWSSQIKKVSEVRVGADLESAMIKWHLDFYGEFSNVCVALQIGPDSGERDSWEDYLHRYARWGGPAKSRSSSLDHLYTNRDLVDEIYIWETSRRADPRLLRLDAEQERIETSAMPSELHSLLAHLQSNSANLQVALRAWEVGGAENKAAQEPREPSTSYSLRSNAETGWQFDERIPALVHPIFHYTHHGAFDQKALSIADPVDWVVVVLSQETIQKRILPELMQRYFSGSKGLEYKLAVVAEGSPPRVLYTSDAGFGTQVDTNADAVMNIFGPPPESTRIDLWHIHQNTTALRGEDWHRFSSPVWFPVIQKTSGEGPWALVLQNRHGRFDAAVTRVWRTNLLTGGALLLLLAASMVLVVVASQHAQKLASLQMDFVASVSHELRTPLTVILSSAENVRDGLPEGRNAFMEQGSVITDQANQLMELVDQVLRFAVTSKSARLHLSPIRVDDLVESALRNTADLLQRVGFQVEKRIPTDLPDVVGDLPGLVQCLQNLIINAVKYSDRNEWIGISAGTSVDPNGRREVGISVADHGIGIASSELTQIFEPFYRSPRAVAAQVRGTGLGLAIAKRHAEAFGGRLSVVSEVGIGSVFTLHLPAVEVDSELTPRLSEATTRLQR